MKVFYTSDGEDSAVMNLDDLIDNLLASDADVDVTAMRGDVEGHGWYTGTHDFGSFLVLDLDRYWGRMQ